MSALRLEIVSGVLPPGGRLPMRPELEARFGSSSITVQNALNQLAGASFVESRGSHGTFENARPPRGSSTLEAIARSCPTCLNQHC